MGLWIIQNVPCALLSRREGRGPVLVAFGGRGAAAAAADGLLTAFPLTIGRVNDVAPPSGVGLQQSWKIKRMDTLPCPEI